MKYERTKKEAKARKKFEPTRQRNEREEREERERHEKREEREWIKKCRANKMRALKKEFEYITSVYGVKDINRKLSYMNSDEWEIYKARKYVRKENANGHKCYNGIEGKKLWINREAWKNMHER